MSRTASSALSLALMATLAAGSSPCGAMPQDRIVQRPSPNSQRLPAPTPMTPSAPMTPTQGAQGNSHDFGAGRSGGGLGREITATRTPSDPRASAGIRPHYYPGSRTLVPRRLDRAVFCPTPAYWRDRDLMAEIKWMARSGFIPVSPIGDSVDMLTDYSQLPAGWRAYGVSVPPGGTVVMEVQHPKSAWFRLMLMDKWGQHGPGMLESAIAHRPIQVFYKNPNKEARAVYLIVDDPGWWSDARDPYTLLIRRDWDPAKTDLSQVQMAVGLWGAMPSVSAEFRGPSLTGPAVYPR